MEACRENARRFSPERFRREFGVFVEREWAAFDDERRRGTAHGPPTQKAGAAQSPAASPA
jgi:hypothetical protein